MEAIIILLIPLFQEWIKQCQNRNTDPLQVIAGLRKPGLRERFGIFLVVFRNRKALGLKGRGFKVKDVVNASYTRLCNASDDQILMLATDDTAELVESMVAEANAA